jgi:hypothetical protein
MRLVSSALVATAVAFVSGAPRAAAQLVPGRLYVSGWKTSIWEVDPSDPANWTATLFADASDGLNGASALLCLPTGELIESNYYDDKILSLDAAGTVTTKWDATQGLSKPFGQNGLATTLAGDVYVSNYGLQQVLLFPASGAAPTVLTDSSKGVVHADGIELDGNDRLMVANRDGMNVLQVLPNGTTRVFDTLPDMPMSIALRNNGDVYVGCFYGDVYLYPHGDAAARKVFLSFGRTLATPVLRFGLDYKHLYMTSSKKGNLLDVDPDTGKYVVVLKDGTFVSPLSIEVAGTRLDIGMGPYGRGVAGTGDLVPSIDAIGHPVSGYSTTLQIRDFVGGAIANLVVCGSPSSSAYKGGTALVQWNDLITILPIQLPGWFGVPGAGDLDWPVQIPSGSVFTDVTYYLQMFALDPQAPVGMSMSNGFRITFREF